MADVTCRAVQTFMDVLRDRGIDPQRLAETTRYPPEYFKDKNNRITWAEFVAMGKSMRELAQLSDADLVEVGRGAFKSGPLRVVMSLGRVLGEPARFYKWMQRGNAMLFANMTSTVVDKDKNTLSIHIRLRETDEQSQEYLLISKGAIASMPTLLGYPEARVELRLLPHEAVFDVTMEAKKRSRLFRAVQAFRGTEEAADELLSAHQSLTVAFRELEEYKTGLEKLVDERTAQLREAQAARERFFGNISHEIRTPLSLILLAAGDIDARAGAAMDERAKKGLGSITDAARKLVRLVDELLLLAAGQEDKLRLYPEPTDLAALVDNAIAAWRPAAENAGLTLTLLAPKTLVLKIDPTAIERVVSNLLSNAMKYTPRGGTVEVEVESSDAGVRLSVLDNGPGIDEDLAGRLFGRFERAAGESRPKVGTGIGLSLVKELVEGHGGKVAARGRQIKGTEMRVDLPASLVLHDFVVSRSQPRPQAPLPASGPANITSGAKYAPPGVSAGTILVAEDDPNLAEMIAKLLSEEYTVVVGLDGQAAAELIPANQPHLLVTDVDMPRMNGIELAKKFRETTGDKLAPIIILSAVLDLGTRVAGLEAGAIDYVTKPFDPAELRARVRAQFRMREMAMRLHRAEQLSSMGILVSGLAHEIRNPANGIFNAVAPLKSMLPKELLDPNGGVAQLLDVMSQCAAQINSMSRTLLSFRSGGDALEMKTAQIPDLVERAITLASGSLDGLELRKALAVEGQVICAPSLLVQVLTNLIENAAHAAGRGGWIDVAARAEGGKITVEVADSGPGVPMPLRERVFEPFFTTKDPGKGTGLGLSVARAIVTRHGGVLEIRDKGGRPAFVMEIPQKVVGAATKPV